MDHKGKVITIDDYNMQPFTTVLQPFESNIVSGIFKIFSNPEVTKYNKRLYIRNYREAEEHFKRFYNGYFDGSGFTYFILHWPTKQLVGLILLISTNGIIQSIPLLPLYLKQVNDLKVNLQNAWCLEYYSDPRFRGLGIVRNFLDAIIGELFSQGASTIMAFCDDDNYASRVTLERLHFIKRDERFNKNEFLWIRQ